MIVYKEEAYKIMGAAFKVYNGLGHGFLEAVYQEALEIEFQKQGIPYEREKELKIIYDGVELKQTYKVQSRLCLFWEDNRRTEGGKRVRRRSPVSGL